MTRSLLLRRRLPPEAEPQRGTIIVLHGGNGDLDDLVPAVRSFGPHWEVFAAEAARAVYVDQELVAHTWFAIQEPGRPEPVSFGDSLFQLEQLVYEISEANQDGPEPLYLLGYDQGALLALALSLVVPDYLAGVAAICGCLPQIAAWPLPDRPLDNLPVLLVYDPQDSKLPAELVEATGSELVKRGGVATLRAVSGARELDSRVLTEVRDWLPMRIK